VDHWTKITESLLKNAKISKEETIHLVSISTNDLKLKRYTSFLSKTIALYCFRKKVFTFFMYLTQKGCYGNFILLEDLRYCKTSS